MEVNMKLGVFRENNGSGDPIDNDGYPKSRMPDNPPPMYHKHCNFCEKIWWTANRSQEKCPFCEKGIAEEIA